jgi:dephospho-CoA kinase
MIGDRMNQPIIIGLSGLAGAGKTSVADWIVPQGSMFSADTDIVWNHIFFALPLYELASIKKTISGINEKKRKLFAIHEVLYDIYGRSSIGRIPEYQDFVELVSTIESLPINQDGKPRSFLQKAGDLCRNFNPDCFAEWGINRSKDLYRSYISSLKQSDVDTDAQVDIKPYAVIISDVRFYNEALAIKAHPHGILINFDATEETRNKRLLDRDGFLMSSEQKAHKSENEMDLVKSLCDIIIDTNDMTVEEQANSTINFIKGMVYAKN